MEVAGVDVCRPTSPIMFPLDKRLTTMIAPAPFSTCWPYANRRFCKMDLMCVSDSSVHQVLGHFWTSVSRLTRNCNFTDAWIQHRLLNSEINPYIYEYIYEYKTKLNQINMKQILKLANLPQHRCAFLNEKVIKKHSWALSLLHI